MPVKLTIAIATLLAAHGLAACGSDETVGGASEEEVVVAESGPVEGDLTVSNRPGYIDPGKNGSVAEFEEQTGATVNYIEDINSNLQFFGKMQPLLDQGESGGRDIIVVTDWMAKRMYSTSSGRTPNDPCRPPWNHPSRPTRSNADYPCEFLEAKHS